MITVGGQFVPYTQIGEMITQQWKKIGIDAAVKEMERNQAFGTTANSEHQIITWANDGSEMLFLFPRHAMPVDPAECHMGMAFAKWFASGGNAGREAGRSGDAAGPSSCTPRLPTLKEADQIKTGQELWKIIVEQQWSIGTVGQSPAFMGVRVVKNNMGNVPAAASQRAARHAHRAARCRRRSTSRAERVLRCLADGRIDAGVYASVPPATLHRTQREEGHRSTGGAPGGGANARIHRTSRGAGAS